MFFGSNNIPIMIIFFFWILIMIFVLNIQFRIPIMTTPPNQWYPMVFFMLFLIHLPGVTSAIQHFLPRKLAGNTPYLDWHKIYSIGRKKKRGLVLHENRKLTASNVKCTTTYEQSCWIHTMPNHFHWSGVPCGKPAQGDPSSAPGRADGERNAWSAWCWWSEHKQLPIEMGFASTPSIKIWW